MNLGLHPQWLRLLHMKRTWAGGWRSQADGINFFRSPRGKTDPSAELAATLDSFFEPVSSSTADVHPQSLFPARYEWLKSELKFQPERLPEVRSPRLGQWRSTLDVDGISIVFAAAYLNNPASMFGHTFLRLHRGAWGGRDPLLDNTANFAAVTPTQSGIKFAVWGLLGGYPGVFSTQPFYMKVQQYNNMENRDLWEYDLRLSSAQIVRFMDHLWELGHTHFNYFFLTENCSYQLLPLLEVADPDRSLSRGFHFKAIPVDTLRRVINQRDFVSERRVRPSQVKVLLTRRARLSPTERRWAERAGRVNREDGLESVRSFPEDRRGLLLDSAYDYFRIRHKFRRYGNPRDEAFERALLLARGNFPSDSLDVPADARAGLEPPETGHPTGRISLGYGAGRGYTFEEIELRPSLHDLTDPSPGYPEGSQLNMFGLKVRTNNQNGHAALERGTLVDIVSLSPWDAWTRTPTWKFFMGWERARDLSRLPNPGTHFALSGGSGFSAAVPGKAPGLLFARLEADAGVGGIFKEHVRLGTGVTMGALFVSNKVWRTYVEGGVRRYFWGQLDTVTRWSWSNNWSLGGLWVLRSEVSRAGVSREAAVSVGRFL